MQGQVAFGAVNHGFNVKYSYGSVACSTAQFYDPFPGVKKACYCIPTASVCPIKSCSPPHGATLAKLDVLDDNGCPTCSYVYGQEDVTTLVYKDIAEEGTQCAWSGGDCDCNGEMYFGTPETGLWSRLNTAGPTPCECSCVWRPSAGRTLA